MDQSGLIGTGQHGRLVPSGRGDKGGHTAKHVHFSTVQLESCKGLIVRLAEAPIAAGISE